MHNYNETLKRRDDQEKLAEEYSSKMLSQLRFIQQEAFRLGNNGGESSEIERLIGRFEAGETSQTLLSEAEEIIGRKEAGIDATSGGH